MKSMKYLAILALGTLFCWAARGEEPAVARSKPQPVPILQNWHGKLADAVLRKAEPADHVVADPQAWSTLWRAWRGQENVPTVDFQKQLILVFTADGPNTVGCTPAQDGQGNLQANAMSTLMAGPGFGYVMLSVSREGVKTVNGKAALSAGERTPGKSLISPVQECKDVVPKPKVFQLSSAKKPVVLRTEKEAAEHFDEVSLVELLRQADFARQFVLVFAWRGSGQDRLEYAVAELNPEEIQFTYRPGRTRDLRQHVRVFALPANLTWRVK